MGEQDVKNFAGKAECFAGRERIMVYSVVMVLRVEQSYKDEHCAVALASQTKGNLAGVIWSAQLPPVPGPQAALPSLSVVLL